MTTADISGKPAKPWEAKVAVRLLVLLLVVGLARTLFEPMPVDPNVPAWFVLLLGSITFLWAALFVYLIATGRRWALILSVVMFFAGLLLSLPFLAEENVGMVVAFSIQSLACLVAYGLLFTKASRIWFSESRAYRKARKQPNQAIEPTY